MSFEVTVTPTVYDVEVEVNPSVQPFDVEVTVGNVPDLDLTTNGDSGASTFDPLTGELNIPNYTLDGLGGVPESRTITINGTTQDLSANRTFTIPAPDPVTIGSPANGLAIDGNQVLTIGLASGSQAGALSSTDWSTFNNKQNAIGYTPENVANKAINFTSPDDTKYPTTLAVSTALAGKQDLLTNPITGTGVAGQVSFWNGTSTQTGDSGLVWDNVNKQLLIKSNDISSIRGVSIEFYSNSLGRSAFLLPIRSRGTISSPENCINGDVIFSVNSQFRFSNNLTTNRGTFGTKITSSNGGVSTFFTSGESNDDFQINLIVHHSKKVGIGNFGNFSLSTIVEPTATLDVNGTGRIRNGVSLADVSGNVQIGTTTDAGFRLDVNGTARVQGAITGTSSLTLGQTGTNGEVILNRTTTGTSVGGIRAIPSGTEMGGASYNDRIFLGNGSGIDFFTWTGVASNSSQRVKIFGTSGNVLIQPAGGTFTNIASSALSVNSTTKGFLPPRMTGAQAEAISSPAEGLLVYSTDGTGTTITSKGWWGFDGSTWAQLN